MTRFLFSFIFLYLSSADQQCDGDECAVEADSLLQRGRTSQWRLGGGGGGGQEDVKKCEDWCREGDSTDKGWFDHDKIAGQAAGKCSWKSCDGCEECKYPLVDFSMEVMAFVNWTAELVLPAKQEDCPGDYADHYASDATLEVQQEGELLLEMTGGMNISNFVLCQAFKFPVDANAALVNVEHCDGVWRGSFAPFRNATNNAAGLDPWELQSKVRAFVIWGHLEPNGRFQADKDMTCLGHCEVDYPWACGGSGQPATRYPEADPSSEVMAFVNWTAELELPADDCPGHYADHYSNDATLEVQQEGELLLDMTGGTDISNFICQAFKLAVDPNAGLVSVEHCNGVWRGSFAPFRNATNNAAGLDPWELQSKVRAFVIWGHLDSNGRFQADKDVTCLGHCKVDYPWTCN